MRRRLGKTGAFGREKKTYIQVELAYRVQHTRPLLWVGSFVGQMYQMLLLNLARVAEVQGG